MPFAGFMIATWHIISNELPRFIPYSIKKNDGQAAGHFKLSAFPKVYLNFYRKARRPLLRSAGPASAATRRLCEKSTHFYLFPTENITMESTGW
jgi:hypothetical protein